MDNLFVSRTEARTVTCPYCHAAPFTKCFGKRKPRESNHRERVQWFLAQLR